MKKNSFLIVFLFLFGCHQEPIYPEGNWQYFSVNQTIYTNYAAPVDPFNTTMQLRYYVNDKVDTELLVDSFSSEIIRLHKLFDRHNYYYLDDNNHEQGLINNLRTINESYGKEKAIKVDKELIDILKLSISYSKLSKGTFNIFVGTLSLYWDDIFADYNNFGFIDEIDPLFNSEVDAKIKDIVACIPPANKIDEVFIIDEINSEITFKKYKNDECNDASIRPSITLGAVGKGYATKKIVNKLNELGFKDGQLISGGSSISALGNSFLKDGQTVTITDPRNSFMSSSIAFSFRSKSKFNLSTSGNYTSGKNYAFVDKDSKEVIYRHHILNPFTGIPSNYHRSVSVFSETVDSDIMDILSTIFMNLTIEEGLAFKKELNYLNVNIDVAWINQIGIDVQCAGDYCPPYPSVLHLYTTTNFNKTLKAEKEVVVHYET